MPDSKSKANEGPRPVRPVAPRRARPVQPAAPVLPAPEPIEAPTSGDSRPPTRHASAAPSSRPLGQTPGPDPDVPLEQVRLTIGTIAGTHGTDGELKLRLATDDPDQLFRLKRVFIGDEPTARRLLSVRFHAGMALIRISGVSRPDTGRQLLGVSVRISGRDARPLQEGEFYFYQVIGITAYDEAGAVLGTVTDILETGANDVFVVTPPDGGKEEMHPNIPSVVIDLDPAQKKIVLRPLVYWDTPSTPPKPKKPRRSKKPKSDADTSAAVPGEQSENDAPVVDTAG